MENTQDFLNGLDKLTFVDYKDNVLHTKEGFEIGYVLELMNSDFHIMPIQFQFRVRKNGVHVTTWGCWGNDDVALCVKWWRKMEWDTRTNKLDKKDLKSKKFKNQFNQLIK